jgi:peptidoglycan/LPS O-acetylase OafA/YrhL
VPDGMISNGLLMPFLGLVLFGLAHSKSKVFGHPLFVRLGDASYSVYLLHIPLWMWMQRTDCHLTHIQTSTPKIFFVLYLTSLICISLLSLRFIETPARRLIRNRPKPGPSLSDVRLRISA